MDQEYLPFSTSLSDYGLHNPGPGKTHKASVISPSFCSKDHICSGSFDEKYGKLARELHTSSSHHVDHFQLHEHRVLVQLYAPNINWYQQWVPQTNKRLCIPSLILASNSRIVGSISSHPSGYETRLVFIFGMLAYGMSRKHKSERAWPWSKHKAQHNT